MHVKILISSPNRKKERYLWYVIFNKNTTTVFRKRLFFTSSLSSGNILQNVTSSLLLLNSCVNQKVYSGKAQSPVHTCMWSKDVNIKKLTRTVVKRYKINKFRSFRLKLKIKISFKYKERSLVSTFQLFVKKNV